MHRILIFPLLLAALLLTNNISAQIAFRLGSDSIEYGKDITIDLSGNIILTGFFYGTVDFDPKAGVSNLTSNGYIDNFIAKYGANSDYQWAICFGGSGADGPNSVKTNSNGNVFVCGYFSNQVDFDPGPGTVIRTSNGNKDAYIAKFDSNGNFVWVNTFGADSNDEVLDLRLDKSSNVFVTGNFQHTIDVDPGPATVNLASNGGNDIFLVKYSSSGDYIFGFNLGGSGNDAGTAIITDTSGNVGLSGYFSQTVDFDPGGDATTLIASGNTDVFIAKYSNTGTFLWAEQIGGKGPEQTSPGGIAINWQQSIFITGGFAGTMKIGESPTSLTSHGSNDVFLIKYTNGGVFQSAISFGGKGQDIGQRVSIDNFGEIGLAGSFKDTVDFDPGIDQHIVYSNGKDGASDIFIAKYNSSLNFLWVDKIGALTSNPNDLSSASALTFDDQNNIICTGRFYSTADFDPGVNTLSMSSEGASDIFVAKYNMDGSLWGPTYYPVFSVSSRDINFGGVVIDSTRNILINVSNTGEEDLNIISVATTNPRFSVLPTSCTIPKNQAQEFVVKFSPTDSGVQTGWLIFYHNAFSARDSISLRGSGLVWLGRISLSISTGWNLLSLPMIVGDNRKSVLFPTAKSDAFGYDGSTYTTSELLQTGAGYWLRFDSPQNVDIDGQPIAVDTVNVFDGWNLIGSLSYRVETDSIIQDPNGIVGSSYFEYNTSYTEVSTLVPGKGYWVKVNQDGILILNPASR